MKKFAKILFDIDSDGTVSIARIPKFIEEMDLIRVVFPREGNTWGYSQNPKKGVAAEVITLLEEYDSRSVVKAKVVMTKLSHTVIAKIPTVYTIGEKIRIRLDNELKIWVPSHNGVPAKILKIY